ncbi:MAG: hypothetical protein RR131_03285 [Anaerovorax sp.]
MKQFMVLCSMILLGVVIFNLIMGDSQDSVLSTVKEVWHQQVILHEKTP